MFKQRRPTPALVMRGNIRGFVGRLCAQASLALAMHGIAAAALLALAPQSTAMNIELMSSNTEA
jgi:hypothetical protein